MGSTLSRSLLIGVLTVVAATASVARAADTFQFADITGWWSAKPQYGGESSHIVLHFLEENGKQAARLSLLGIGGYEVPIGTVTIDGMSLDMKPYPFPLRFDPKQGTLSGPLPEAAVPVYQIPAEFRRIEPLAKPAARTWDYPRPRVRWTFDTGAAGVGGHRARCRKRIDLRCQRRGHALRTRCQGRAALAVRDRQARQGTAGGHRRLRVPGIR